MIVAQTVLDHIIFQLTPTRTRFDLNVVSGSVTEKLTSGLLQPFLSHLQTAQEQFATGGYSIQIEPNPSYNKSSWFTKDTVERFVRFVSTPEVIERVNTIESELMQLEETIGAQNPDATRDDLFVVNSPATSLHGEKLASLTENSPFSKMIRREYGSEPTPSKNTKDQLYRALNARRSVLLKEQGMAFARASAAGFELCHLMQLIVFSESFRAVRMKEACTKFVTLCQKQQIPGFCSDAMLSIDKDLVEAVAKTGCWSILSLERETETHTVEHGVYAESHSHTDHKPSFQSVSHDEWKLDDGFGSSENPFSGERQYQQKVPVYISSSPATQVCHWSTAREWPNVYTITNNSSPFQAHQCGFSPGSQESFNILSDMSPPPDATAKFHHLIGVHNQLSPDVQTHQNSYERKYFSPGRESAGFRNSHRDGMTTCKNFSGNHHRQRKQSSDEESVGDDYDKETSEVTDSSMDISITPKPGSMTPQPRFNSPEVLIDGSRSKWDASADLKFSNTWKNYQDHRVNNGKSKSEQEIRRSGRGIEEVDEAITLLQSRRPVNYENTVSYTPMLDAELQESKGSSTIDNSSLIYDQHTDYVPGIRSKKRLEFQELETSSCKIKVGKDLMPLDDSSFVHVQRMDKDQDQRNSLFIESEMQGSKIYDMMSKKALMVNSTADKQKEHDELLMMPRRKNNSSSTGHGNDLMKIDIDLQKSTYQTQSSNHLSGHFEPSQERVKKFVDQYNEKKEAKLRGNIQSSKRAEREKKMKAMEDVLEKRKGEVNRGKIAERRSHVTASQPDALDIRAYKTALKKSKQEKEDEERKRLEVLKAQRQERIAARRNVNSLFTQGKSASSSPPRSKLSPLKKPSILVQKARSSSLLGSQSMPSLQFIPRLKETELNGVRSKIPSRFRRNHVRSSSPSVMDHHHDDTKKQIGISTSLTSGNFSESAYDKVQFKAPANVRPSNNKKTISSDVTDDQATLDAAVNEDLSISNGLRRQSSILSPTALSTVDNTCVKPRVKTPLLDASVKVTSFEKGMLSDGTTQQLKMNGISQVEGKGFLKKGGGISFGAKGIKLTSPEKVISMDTLLIPALEESTHNNGLKIKIKSDVNGVLQTEPFVGRTAESHVGPEVRPSAPLSEIADVDSTGKIQNDGIITVKALDEKINSVEASGCISPSGYTSDTSPELVLKSLNCEQNNLEPKIGRETSQDTNCHKSMEQIDCIPWIPEQSKHLMSSRSYGGELDHPIKNTFMPVFPSSDMVPLSISRVRKEDHDDLSIVESPSGEGSEEPKQDINSFRNASVGLAMSRLTLFDTAYTQNVETYVEPSIPLATATSPIKSLNGNHLKHKSISESSSFPCATQIGTPMKDHYHKGFKSFLLFRWRSPQSQALKSPIRSEEMERESVNGGTSSKHGSMSDDKRWHSDSTLSRKGLKGSAKHPGTDSSHPEKSSGSSGKAKHVVSGPSHPEKSSGSSGKARRTFSFFGTFLSKGR